MCWGKPPRSEPLKAYSDDPKADANDAPGLTPGNCSHYNSFHRGIGNNAVTLSLLIPAEQVVVPSSSGDFL